ncbi:MAG TPA: peptidylprolyl isomerase, partial [Sulfuricurvum sp.]|nr:peptidylprolyl isomerase [Sulfuricurvum sp.]
MADVQPILNKRCVVCHSCYNAPCQLKFSAYEGVARGATKAEVYNAERLEAADPTRLLIDANSAEAWHKQHGFFSVTDNHAAEGFNDAML